MQGSPRLCRPHQDSAGLLQPPSLMEEEAGLLGSTPSVQEHPRGIGGLSLRNVWDSLMVMSEGPEALPLQCVGAAVQVARGGAAHQDAASCWRDLPSPGFSRSLREAEKNCCFQPCSDSWLAGSLLYILPQASRVHAILLKTALEIEAGKGTSQLRGRCP